MSLAMKFLIELAEISGKFTNSPGSAGTIGAATGDGLLLAFLCLRTRSRLTSASLSLVVDDLWPRKGTKNNFR